MKISITAIALLSAASAGRQSAPSGFTVVKRDDIKWMTTPRFGEPHGFDFNDVRFIKDNHRIRGMSLSGCDSGSHFGYMQTTFGPLPTKGHPVPASANQLSPYGTRGGGDMGFTLEDGEIITQVDVATFRPKTGFFHMTHRTRIGYIKLYTNKGHTHTCGSKGPKDDFKSWYFDGYALAYFTGSFGAAIDAISGTFMPIDKYFA